MAPREVTLRAELRYRDGVQKKELRVTVRSDLTSVIAGVQTLRQQVSDLLTELTVREKESGPAGDKDELDESHDDDEDEDDEDDDEDDEDTEIKVSEPPAKKSKPVKK